MARLIDHAHEELTPLDELRQRRILRIKAAAEADDGTLEALAVEHGLTVAQLLEWAASGLDPELQALLMTRRRAAVLEAGGVPREEWRLDA